jgi:hypothetical protein
MFLATGFAEEKSLMAISLLLDNLEKTLSTFMHGNSKEPLKAVRKQCYFTTTFTSKS